MTCEEHQKEFLKRVANEKYNADEVKEASTEEVPAWIRLAKLYGNIPHNM